VLSGIEAGFSGTWGIEVRVGAFEREVPGLESGTSSSIRNMPWNSWRSDNMAAPAAAIICGLRGLDDELARLPFLEC